MNDILVEIVLSHSILADWPDPAPTGDRVPRILSLDGGGVRGLSSLLILREIMEDLREAVNATEPVKPCEYFDLIGGSSTGGLIAVMLGALGMVASPIITLKY